MPPSAARFQYTDNSPGINALHICLTQRRRVSHTFASASACHIASYTWIESLQAVHCVPITSLEQLDMHRPDKRVLLGLIAPSFDGMRPLVMDALAWL